MVKEYNNVGKIVINKSYTRNKSLFCHPVKVDKFISLDFNTGKVYDNGKKIYPGDGLYKIGLSNDQWANLLLNSNNSNGSPCTFLFKNDSNNRRTIKFNNTTNNNINGIDYSFLENVSIKIKELFPTYNNIKNEVNKLIYTKNPTKKEADELKKILNKLSSEFLDHKSELISLLEKNINTMNNTVDKKFTNDLKDNFLGFASIDKKDTALKLLGIFNKEIKTLDYVNKKEEKESIVDDSFGIIKLKNIVRNEGDFIGDSNAKNGMKIELYEAKIDIINGINTTLPTKKVLETEMSSSQFNDLITGFSVGEGFTSTITYTKDLGKIERKNISLELLEILTQDFQNYLENLNEKIDKQIEKTSNIIKNKVGPKKARQVEIEFEQFYNYIISNIPFYFEDIYKEKNNSNINKRQDIQFSIQKVIVDLGMEKLNEKLKDNDINSIKQIFNKKDSIQLKNKNEDIIELD